MASHRRQRKRSGKVFSHDTARKGGLPSSLAVSQREQSGARPANIRPVAATGRGF